MQTIDLVPADPSAGSTAPVDGAIWPDTVEPSVLAALDPGVSDALDRAPDVLVIGGGMLGLATAWQLRLAGVERVVLIERDRLASHASGGAGALITPGTRPWEDPPAVAALAVESAQLLYAFDADCGGATGLRSMDMLTALPFDLPDGFDPAPPTERIDAAGMADVEPELRGAVCGLLVRDQAHVNPLRYAAALAARGGTAATGVSARGFDVDAGRIVAVRTSHGDFTPGSVVLATGRTGLPRPQIPERWVKGHLIGTEPAPFRLRVGLSTPNGLVVQLADGRLVTGGTRHEGDESVGADPVTTDEIAAHLATLLPAARGLRVTHRWSCFRPATADGVAVADRVPGTDNAWCTAGHDAIGILMAAVTGRILAEWIVGGERPDRAAALAWDRPVPADEASE
ncbi:MAG: thiO1 [Actinomycetia bacterium]|nr:thiO1 [Actinomycetes bacterium]